MDKWSWTKDDNPYILEAVAREEDRAVWRTYYMEKAVFNLNRVYIVNKSGMPTRPDLLPEPIQEPADLEEFLAIIRTAFQMASAAFIEDTLFGRSRGSRWSSWPTDSMRWRSHSLPLV